MITCSNSCLNWNINPRNWGTVEISRGRHIDVRVRILWPLVPSLQVWAENCRDVRILSKVFPTQRFGLRRVSSCRALVNELGTLACQSSFWFYQLQNSVQCLVSWQGNGSLPMSTAFSSGWVGFFGEYTLGEMLFGKFLKLYLGRWEKDLSEAMRWLPMRAGHLTMLRIHECK